MATAFVRPVIIAAAGLLMSATLASAHAKLDKTSPDAGSTVQSPQMIAAHFSEAIEPKLSSLKLTAGDGTSVAIMSMNDAKDPTTLSIMPNTKLPPGAYTVTWSVVSDDGHKTHGMFTFTVK